MVKLSAAFLILLIALAFQMWLAAGNIFINLTFAALITLAFFVNWGELLALVLAGVFLLNWQPTWSMEIVFIALYPLAVRLSHSLLLWQTWLAAPSALLVGFLGIYLLTAPNFLQSHPTAFFMDVAGGLLFAFCLLFPLQHWKR